MISFTSWISTNIYHLPTVRHKINSDFPLQNICLVTKTGRRIAKSWSLVFPGECWAVDEQNENTLDSVSEHPHSTECKELGRWCYWENKWREWERGESPRGGRRQLPFFSLWHRCEMQECAGFKHRSGQIWFGMHPDLVHFRMLTTLSLPFFQFHVFRLLGGSCAPATQTAADTWETLTLPVSLAHQTPTVRWEYEIFVNWICWTG